MNSIKRVKFGCYMTNVSMAVVSSISPILFLTFRSMYGISYSLLGLLVLVNFCTQLSIDIIFSFFSHKFNIPKTVRFTPVLTALGLMVYAIIPMLFPSLAYVGIIAGTVIFSASGGLAEVLMSPVIAALPSDNGDREMSKLHSIYAWGVVGVVAVSTAFILLFGTDNWYWLALILAGIPIIAAIFFAGADIPKMATPEKTSGAISVIFNKGLLLCFLCMFLGGASECIMGQWSSGYIEKVLGIPKLWGDIFGFAFFSVMLGLGRSLYAKIGKNVNRVLFFGATGAVICYAIAAFSSSAILGLIACAVTGFCVSMLWPGSLIYASGKFPLGGVTVYALMAAGGDLGASVGPQLVGLVTDGAMQNPDISALAVRLGLTAEQMGMKTGMAVAIIFPVAAAVLYGILWKKQSKRSK